MGSLVRCAAGGWRIAALGVLMGAAAALWPSASQAAFMFEAITSTSTASELAALEAGFVMDVTIGSGMATFMISNNAAVVSSITRIYFDAGPFAAMIGALSLVNQSPGVDFGIDATPGNLPAGNTIGFDADASAGANPPVSPNGVHPGESITLKLVYSGFDLLAALNSGDFRVGLHVQSIGRAGQSDSFVNTPMRTVPEPGTLALLGTGAVGMSFGAWRKRRKAKLA